MNQHFNLYIFSNWILWYTLHLRLSAKSTSVLTCEIDDSRFIPYPLKYLKTWNYFYCILVKKDLNKFSNLLQPHCSSLTKNWTWKRHFELILKCFNIPLRTTLLLADVKKNVSPKVQRKIVHSIKLVELNLIIWFDDMLINLWVKKDTKESRESNRGKCHENRRCQK